MFKLLFLSLTLFLLLFINGCHSKVPKEIEDALKRDRYYEKALSYTKKGEIIKSLETKAIIFATYLNKLDKKYKSDTNSSFLIGVYIDNDFKKDEKKGLNNPNFTLKYQDGSKPILIKGLKEDSTLLKSIPLVNSWSNYYLVTFKDNHKRDVELIYTLKNYGETKLLFKKELLEER